MTWTAGYPLYRLAMFTSSLIILVDQFCIDYYWWCFYASLIGLISPQECHSPVTNTLQPPISAVSNAPVSNMWRLKFQFHPSKTHPFTEDTHITHTHIYIVMIYNYIYMDFFGENPPDSTFAWQKHHFSPFKIPTILHNLSIVKPWVSRVLPVTTWRRPKQVTYGAVLASVASQPEEAVCNKAVFTGDKWKV